MNIYKKLKHILAVDDIIDNLKILEIILKTNGYKISMAQNGKKGLRMAQDLLPDLILLDISMGDLNGIEICKILKKDEKTKEIPIIFLTALNDDEVIIKAFEAGGLDYVLKPFNYNELLARVKTHLEIKQKNDEIKEYAEQLHAVNEEYKQIYEFVSEQTKTVELKNKDLMDSINYAKFIQKSFLPNLKKLSSIFPNSFIYEKSKELISGDFYFFEKIKDKIIIGIADCTGHGVPGAMLSILGIALLIRIVQHKEITSPKKILTILNKDLLEVLSNSENQNKVMDGMDISICSIDLKSNILQFSGAKRPLLFFRDNKLKYYKGSVRSIGGYDDGKKQFFNKEINLQKDDLIFLFTDGYIDQFGGEENKKFSIKRFKNLMTEISFIKNTKEQKEKIKIVIEDWMKKEEQIDDILVMGLKI